MKLVIILAFLVAVPAFAGPGKPAFPLRVSDSGRFFVDHDREPFLYFADTAWSLMSRPSKEEVLRYFQTRREQGFTVVQAHLLPRRIGAGAATNRFGQAPFEKERDLARMTPRGELASTGYCLADAGRDYVAYLPDGGEVTVDLAATTSAIAAEWLHPVNGTLTSGGTIDGGAKRTFKAPFYGGAVLRLWKSE